MLLRVLMRNLLRESGAAAATAAAAVSPINFFLAARGEGEEAEGGGLWGAVLVATCLRAPRVVGQPRGGSLLLLLLLLTWRSAAAAILGRVNKE